MKDIRSRFWVLLLALALGSGCGQGGGLSDMANPKREPGLSAVEGGLFFAVSESYADLSRITEPALALSMATEKIYGCCNFRIETDVRTPDGQFQVEIRGVDMSGPCLMALGPACSRDFTDLPAGIYTLVLKEGLRQDSYVLEVKPESVTVSGGPPAWVGFTRPRFTVFWRYPRNSFAYLCGTTEDTVWIYEDFLAKLRAEVELEEHIFPPNGEIGFPRATQGYHRDMPGRYFVYRTEEDFARAGEILRSYSRDVISQYQGVGVWLLNWKNQEYCSWLLD